MSSQYAATLSKPLGEFVEQAYLDYAMMVIMERALPHVGDGLKLVQRRILYAMSELGLKETAKHKKSARTVGDVLGKFHPHGETACYEAMVLMAQPFTQRYKLIDGQGNWGSIDDPKSFAAMRYTEARLAPYATSLLQEVGLGTVDWAPNFDGTLREPCLLPARLPNVILNGSSGIAVGMATDIPPHNCREIVKACLHILNNPECTDESLFKFVQGPDFPMGGEIITPKADVKRIYTTGKGSIKCRATFTVTNSQEIVINSLPYQASLSKTLEQIGGLMQAKSLPMVVDIRDESDEDHPVKIVLVLRSNRVNAEEVMQHLFAVTDLEKNIRVNMNIIGNDGRPAVKSLKTILSEWLTYRVHVVKRRLSHRLDQLNDRLHILDGLYLIFAHLDEIIRIIREEEDPKATMMAKFGLTDMQADAILNTRLKHLARLEEDKLMAEKSEAEAEKARIELLLSDQNEFNALIESELKEDVERYGDPRRTKLVEREAARAISEVDTMANEPVTVVLSKHDWIRLGKGHDLDVSNIGYRAGDSLAFAMRGHIKQALLLADQVGRVFSVATHQLPSVRGQGDPLTKYCQKDAKCPVVSMLLGQDDDKVIMLSQQGLGFAVPYAKLISQTRNGRRVMDVAEGDMLLNMIGLSERDQMDRLALLTSEGRLLVISVSDIPSLNKGRGNKLIKLVDGEKVLSACGLGTDHALVCQAGARTMTLKGEQIEAFVGKRTHRGRVLPRGFQRSTSVSPKK